MTANMPFDWRQLLMPTAGTMNAMMTSQHAGKLPTTDEKGTNGELSNAFTVPLSKPANASLPTVSLGITNREFHIHHTME